MKNFFKSIKRRDSHDLTFQIAQEFARNAGPYQEELNRLIEGKDVAALATLDLDYSRFSNAADVYGARSCLALFTKCDDFDLGIDKAAVAFAKFVECETSCREANWRLSRSNEPYLRHGYIRDGLDKRVFDVITMASDIVRRIIGETPPLVDDLPLAFGPGASSTVKKYTSARWKLSAKPACSANMASSVVDVLATMPHYCELHNCRPEPRSPYESVFWEYGYKNQKEENFWTVEVAIEPGKLMFVPKNAKTDRSIIVEPTLNSYLQKGYGTHLKQKLKKSWSGPL
jgi:hypothetical protein